MLDTYSRLITLLFFSRKYLLLMSEYSISIQTESFVVCLLQLPTSVTRIIPVCSID